MEKVIRAIGCMVVTALMFAPSIGLTLSIVYNWPGFLQLVNLVMCGMQFFAIAYHLYMGDE